MIVDIRLVETRHTQERAALAWEAAPPCTGRLSFSTLRLFRACLGKTNRFESKPGSKKDVLRTTTVLCMLGGTPLVSTDGPILRRAGHTMEVVDVGLQLPALRVPQVLHDVCRHSVGLCSPVRRTGCIRGRERADPSEASRGSGRRGSRGGRARTRRNGRRAVPSGSVKCEELAKT